VSALFTQYPGDTVQSGTGKVDPARKFKCTTAVRALSVLEMFSMIGDTILLPWFQRRRFLQLGREII